MGELVLLLLPEFVGLLITPAAIAGCVLLLQSPGSVRNAVSFGGAFLLVYAQIAIAALLGGATDRSATSHTLSHWVGLVVGLLFLAIGVWLLTRPAKPPGDTPKWMTELESASPRKAFIAGLALAVINPNLFIMLSGISIIASSSASSSDALIGTALLLVAAALDFIIPITAYLLLGDRARTGLDTAKRWMIRHDRALSVGVFLGFGALFTARGIGALLG